MMPETTEQPKRHSPTASRDGEPRIHPSVVQRDCTFGRFVDVAERVMLTECEVGDYTYIERHGELIYATIGKFCAIAANVRINALTHPIERVSQHKMTYRPNEYFVGAKLDKDFRARRQNARVQIGHDIWIGHGAVIMPGLSIGHGAVIGAGAVVTKNVAPYSIVAGVPAKHIKWRFPKSIRTRMIKRAWWEWDHDRLASAIPDMQQLSAKEFLEKYES
jgi:phosphonate metabolism protein (transferase hexapeptide repeat family)